MIAGALAGGALVAWVVAGVARWRGTRAVRRRLRGSPTAPPLVPHKPRRTGAPLRLLPPSIRRNRTLERHRLDDARLAEGCEAIARALRSGRSLSVAVVEAADRHAAPALVEIARAVGVGEQLPVAVDRAAARAVDPDVLLVVQVLAVAAEHGGSQAEAVDRAAATLRERAALHAERQAQAASARLSTRVMTVLPFAFTGFVAATDGDVREVLLRTPVGWTCLTIGVALNLAGRAWAKRAVAT